MLQIAVVIPTRNRPDHAEPCVRTVLANPEPDLEVILIDQSNDDATELAVRERISRAKRRPTEVIDRFWFKSVYFLEPGGVLFEIATDGPGFMVDESLATLGEHLVLPPWLEPHRDEIEDALPVLVARA